MKKTSVILSELSDRIGIPSVNLLANSSLGKYKKKIAGRVYIVEDIKNANIVTKYHKRILEEYDNCFKIGGQSKYYPSMYIAQLFGLHKNFFTMLRYQKRSLSKGFSLHKYRDSFLLLKIEDAMVRKAIAEEYIFLRIDEKEEELEQFDYVFHIQDGIVIGCWK